MPPAQRTAIQRLLKIQLCLIGIMRAIVRPVPLRFGCRFLVDDLAVLEAVADAAVEIDAFGEGRTERARDFLRNIRIDVFAAGDELDPQLALVGAVDVTPDDRRRHEPPTREAAPTLR